MILKESDFKSSCEKCAQLKGKWIIVLFCFLMKTFLRIFLELSQARSDVTFVITYYRVD